MSAEASRRLGPGTAGDAGVDSHPPFERKATPRRNLLVFMGGTLLAVAAGLIAFSLIFNPPRSTFGAMALYLGITAAISLLAGALAYRYGLMRRSPRLARTLLAGYLLAAALTFVNVLITARLMFLSRHDLLLSTVLLVFAAGVAVSIGYLVSGTVVGAVRKLNQGAEAVARGNLDLVVPEEGPEELAELARHFNEMTARLKEAETERVVFEQARRDLILAVGHDLRTPIASVQVITEALADGVVDDPATVQRYLDTARRDLGTLSRLVDDLFVLAQLDSGGVQLDRRPNSLTDLVSDTLEAFSVRAEQQNVRLYGEALAGIPNLEFDASYVGRALANLVDNALRYTPPGGEVLLKTAAVSDGVEVQVRDSGPGIDERDLPHVFERFYRGEASRSRALGGGGLGLAIVKGVVEAHGGSVGVRVAPGAGTTFSFVLPA
jgi:two-component system, OmpR family, sensor histidine kinase SaeS